ncbi:MAG: HlyD family secretion protein [Pseudomonadota bacterium]
MTSVRAWMIALLLLIIVVIVYYVATDRTTPFTTDAYVQTYVVQVAPRIEGQVTQVLATQASQVTKGDPLFRLDPDPYQFEVDRLTASLALAETNIRTLQAQLESGEAVVKQREANVKLAQATFDRISALTQDDFATQQQLDEAADTLRSDNALLNQAQADVVDVQTQLDSMIGDEHSQVAQARAELKLAQYNLEQTTVYAPVDGIIDNMQLQVGKYVDAGDEVMTLIDTAQWWIVANFPENALSIIQPGQKVKLSYFMYPGRIFDGEVTSIGYGVYEGQGIASGELPEVQNPNDWITQSQRFQVRITPSTDDMQPLRVGATARIMILSSDNLVMNGLGRFWLWVGAQLDYLY